MAKQLEFKKVNGWGGKRRGAGRPNRSGQVSHCKRPRVDWKKPLHITLKLQKGLIGLRNPAMMSAFKHSVLAAKAFGLHVIHFSLLHDHIHLIVEASGNESLSRGMKSFTIRLAKSIRTIVSGRGSVWKGRFHLHLLKTPTEMKRALEYVLLNRSKHQDSIEHVDPYSSARAFAHWRELVGPRWRGLLREQTQYLGEVMELSSPSSWLLRLGWMRA